jgi:hypothetical protein
MFSRSIGDKIAIGCKYALVGGLIAFGIGFGAFIGWFAAFMLSDTINEPFHPLFFEILGGFLSIVVGVGIMQIDKEQKAAMDKPIKYDEET